MTVMGARLAECQECGNMQVRRHRHGEGSGRSAYARFQVQQEAAMVRRVYRDAREREDRRR